MKPGYLSEHFSLAELIASDTAARRGINNSPTDVIKRNLKRLCDTALEPIRHQFGSTLVTSGYRCPALNTAIGGSATSYHVYGLAGDLQFHSPEVFLCDVVEWLIASDVPFDQVIYEFGAWVHVAVAKEARAENGSLYIVEPRRQALMIFSAAEGYLAYDPEDSRVTA